MIIETIIETSVADWVMVAGKKILAEESSTECGTSAEYNIPLNEEDVLTIEVHGNDYISVQHNDWLVWDVCLDGIDVDDAVVQIVEAIEEGLDDPETDWTTFLDGLELEET